MAFTPTPVDTSATPVPMSSAGPDGTNTPLAIEAGPSITTGGNTLVPVSMYVKDGNNLVEGITTDAAVTGDNAGTLSAKLRGLSKMFFDVWDSVNHRLHVSVDNANANGQAVMVNSAPVVLASDQSAVKVKPDFTEFIGAGTGVVNGNSTDLFASFDVSAYTWFSLQLAGTWAMTLTIAGSNDNTNFNTIYSQSANNAVGAFFTNMNANGGYMFARAYRYLRVRATGWTSNASLVGTLEAYTTPVPPWFQYAVQAGTWTVMPGNTQNTTPWLVQGPTTTGVQAANSAGNVVIKGTPGALWTATITTLGTAGLLVYDNASTNAGTVLLSIPASAAVGTVYSWFLGQPAANGITSAGVTNCPGVTFGFR
jgi:hypothetical protein